MNTWVPREKFEVREACPAGTGLPKGSRDREGAGAGNLARQDLCRFAGGGSGAGSGGGGLEAARVPLDGARHSRGSPATN